MSDKRRAGLLLLGVVGATLLAADFAILRWWDRSLVRPLQAEPFSVLPGEELVLEGEARHEPFLGADAREGLNLDIHLEQARFSATGKLAEMSYLAVPAKAGPTCGTGFSLKLDTRVKKDSLEVRLRPKPAESDDFRILALQSSAALLLNFETVTPEGEGSGPGCQRKLTVNQVPVEDSAPLAFETAVPGRKEITLRFQRLKDEPQPWLLRPLNVALAARTVRIRKPSGKPGEEALVAHGEIEVRDLALADGRLQVALAGEAQVHGSRVAAPGWLEWRPHSELGWLALVGILSGHGAWLWLALRLPKAGRKVSMEKLFISYNRADREWAEWIAWILEDAGHSTVLDTWDFRPGESFILEMHKAAMGTERTIVVLSENYLKSEYTQPEWAAAFAEDPRGEKRKLIPFRVAPCQPQGLLRALIYVDLVGLGEEDARSAVLGAFSERLKPSAVPRFPGSKKPATQPAPFPGSASASVLAPALRESRPEPRGASLAPDERFALVGKLNALPPQQLNMILFALSPPPGLIPPMPAPQGDRVVALLGWAEGPGGCGLEEVQRLLATVLS